MIRSLLDHPWCLETLDTRMRLTGVMKVLLRLYESYVIPKVAGYPFQWSRSMIDMEGLRNLSEECNHGYLYDMISDNVDLNMTDNHYVRICSRSYRYVRDFVRSAVSYSTMQILVRRLKIYSPEELSSLMMYLLLEYLCDISYAYHQIDDTNAESLAETTEAYNSVVKSTCEQADRLMIAYRFVSCK